MAWKHRDLFHKPNKLAGRQQDSTAESLALCGVDSFLLHKSRSQSVEAMIFFLRCVIVCELCRVGDLAKYEVKPTRLLHAVSFPTTLERHVAARPLGHTAQPSQRHSLMLRIIIYSFCHDHP
jgi:hypothetical protein